MIISAVRNAVCQSSEVMTVAIWSNLWHLSYQSAGRFGKIIFDVLVKAAADFWVFYANLDSACQCLFPYSRSGSEFASARYSSKAF